MASKFILIDEEFQAAVLKDLKELKALIEDKPQKGTEQELMDVPAAMEYLHVCRKTLYKYRQQGLPTAGNESGRLRFWKSDIDRFFGKDKS